MNKYYMTSYLSKVMDEVPIFLNKTKSISNLTNGFNKLLLLLFQVIEKVFFFVLKIDERYERVCINFGLIWMIMKLSYVMLCVFWLWKAQVVIVNYYMGIKTLFFFFKTNHSTGLKIIEKKRINCLKTLTL